MYFLEKNEELVDGSYEDYDNEAWEEKYLDVSQGFKPAEGVFTVYTSAARSWSDEFGSVVTADVRLIQAAFTIMIVYLAANLGECKRVESRILLSLVSVTSIALSIVSSFGLAWLLGFKYTPVHSVLPFVILGLGVDDSFVIVNCFDRTSPNDPIPKRLSDALANAAASITVTSLTDFVAFMISTTSALPALASFCAFAGLGILVLYILQITLFAAAVAIDARRQLDRLPDCCPCCPSARGCGPVPLQDGVEGIRSPPQSKMSSFFEKHYAPFLLRPAVKVFMLSGFFTLFACCAWRMTYLRVEGIERSFIPDGSYLLKTLRANDRFYGEQGTDVSIITAGKGFDVFDQQNGIASIASELAGVNSIHNPSTSGTFSSWLDAFRAWAAASDRPSAALIATDRDAFYANLQLFLASPDGREHARNIVFATDPSGALDPVTDEPATLNNVVDATRIHAQFKPMATYHNGRLEEDTDKVVKAMRDLRAELNSWKNVKAFPWTRDFLMWETYIVIQEEGVRNIALCLLAVLVITLIFIAHPATSFYVWIAVVMTVIDIVGCLEMWGLACDTIVVIDLVIAVGLCVDYSAHIGHCFMTKHGSNDSRVIETLGDIGSAVMNGGLSTFLAVCLLGTSQSYVFRVLFQCFFLTVTLGLAHGMLFLPIVLSLVGPAPYVFTVGEERNYDESKLKQDALSYTNQIAPLSAKGLNVDKPVETMA
jgi:predicted RND superfamily exporter protein